MSTSDAQILDLLNELRAQFIEVRVLPDGTIAGLIGVAHTWVICVDCDRWGYARRFDFDKPSTALQRFREVQSATDQIEGATSMRLKRLSLD